MQLPYNISVSHSSLNNKLLSPFGSRIEEWKKTLSMLDRDHDKGSYTIALVLLSIYAVTTVMENGLCYELKVHYERVSRQYLLKLSCCMLALKL